MPNIEVPVSGQVISAAWGKSVADAINEMRLAWDNVETQRFNASADTTLAAGATALPGCQMVRTPTIAENWLVTSVFDFDVTTAGAGAMFGVPQLDGVNQSGSANASGAAVGHNTITTVTTLFPSVGVEHTLRMVAWKGSSGGVAMCRAQHSRMLVQIVPRSLAAMAAQIEDAIGDVP